MKDLTRLYAEQDKTYAACKKLLNKNGKCLLDRPTGFGKTYLSAKLASEYKRVLFLYPSDVVRTAFDDDLTDNFPGFEKNDGGLEMITMRSLGKLWKLGELDRIRKENFDLVIADEAHCLGMEQTKQAMYELEPWLKERHLFGGTATLERMDNFRVDTEFFNDSKPYMYTTDHAIADGILNKIYYVYFSTHIEKEIKEQRAKLENIKNHDTIRRVEALISALEREVANRINAPELIRKHLNIARPGQNYFKFICFYSRLESARFESEKIAQYYQEAFPHMNVVNLIVTSEVEFRDNLKILNSLTPCDNTIHLIHAVDMINYGWHTPNTTGVTMNRLTGSKRIYQQQAGRVFDPRSEECPVIFDMAGNIRANYLWTPITQKDLDEEDVLYNRIRRMRKRDRKGLPQSGISEHNVICNDEVIDMVVFLDKIAETIRQDAVRNFCRFYKRRRTWDKLLKEFPEWTKDDMIRILRQEQIEITY